MTHAVITDDMNEEERSRLCVLRSNSLWQRCVDRWVSKHYWEGELRWLLEQAKARKTTPYALALQGIQVSWTASAIKHWEKLLGLVWASMTWDEKIHEPMVYDHHYREIWHVEPTP